MSEQERLLTLMQDKGLNAKEFASEVGISSATMSNVINGRNNPSLEVIQKVLNRFRNVSPEWLVLGVGPMYYEQTDSPKDDLSDKEDKRQSVISSMHQRNVTEQKRDIQRRHITRLLIFYDDGTFEEIL